MLGKVTGHRMQAMLGKVMADPAAITPHTAQRKHSSCRRGHAHERVEAADVDPSGSSFSPETLPWSFTSTSRYRRPVWSPSRYRDPSGSTSPYA